MKPVLSTGARATVFAARAFGGTSLLAFGVFLVWGPFQIVDLNLQTPGALAFDGCLCLAFFLQHSGMVRESFQKRIATLVPIHFGGAVYAISSGVMLLVLVFLWQTTSPPLVSVGGAGRWMVRPFCLLALFGFVSGVRALGSFDAFGIRPITAFFAGKKLKSQPLMIRGPYRWVRHPLYTGVLILLWCTPDMAADRILLNTTWTVWVFIGTMLEERDLVSVFGEEYREYQRRVPMLLPLRRPAVVDSPESTRDPGKKQR